MCILQLWTFEKLDFKVQTSFSLFPLSKFHSPFSFSLHSSSPTFKLLSMASYGGELLLFFFFFLRHCSSPFPSPFSFAAILPFPFSSATTPFPLLDLRCNPLCHNVYFWFFFFCLFYFLLLHLFFIYGIFPHFAVKKKK